MIRAELEGADPMETIDLPSLRAPGAAFVTLRVRATDDLRGCIGEMIARRPLIDAVRSMAVAAATRDTRFPRVQADELPSLRIEVSRLTPMVPISPQAVEVGRHGLLLRAGGRSGVLLPQVPTAWGWNLDQYLTALCAKAGLPDDAVSWQDAELLAFEAEVWAEH